MNAQEILNSWYEVTPDERRKEVYEVLLAIPEFGDFLRLLKEYQTVARRQAGAADPKDRDFLLGSAWAIDELIAEIREQTAGSSEAM